MFVRFCLRFEIINDITGSDSNGIVKNGVSFPVYFLGRWFSFQIYRYSPIYAQMSILMLMILFLLEELVWDILLLWSQT